MEINVYGIGLSIQMKNLGGNKMWNKWRSDYDDMSFIQQCAFYQSLNPDLKLMTKGFYSKDLVNYLLQIFQHKPLKILELGGGDGLLAQAVLTQQSEIINWENYDFPCFAHRDLVKYQFHGLTKWFWEYPPFEGFDFFIASHVFEHLKLYHILEIMPVIAKIPEMIVEVPLPPLEKPNWNNYEGTHILDCSKHNLIRFFEVAQYKVIFQQNNIIHLRKC